MHGVDECAHTLVFLHYTMLYEMKTSDTRYAFRPQHVGILLLFLTTCATTWLVVELIIDDPIRTCVKPRIFVGVFTKGGGDAKYATRRALLRSSWVPNTTEALKRLECAQGVTLRFVVGQSVLTNDTKSLKAWDHELNHYDDLLTLNAQEGYHGLTAKSAEFFYLIMNLRQKYEYAVKVDDDMFVSLNHLVKAAEQWAYMKVDYVGCMMNKEDTIFRSKGKMPHVPPFGRITECNAMHANVFNFKSQRIHRYRPRMVRATTRPPRFALTYVRVRSYVCTVPIGNAPRVSGRNAVESIDGERGSSYGNVDARAQRCTFRRPTIVRKDVSRITCLRGSD